VKERLETSLNLIGREASREGKFENGNVKLKWEIAECAESRLPRSKGRYDQIREGE
jgi:hypothetical protein